MSLSDCNAVLEPLRTLPSEADSFAKPKKGFFGKKSELGAFKLLDVVGEGTFGKVKVAMVKDHAREMKVAVKEIQGEEALSKMRHEVEMQIAVHDHPNIPTCYDLIHTKNKAYLAMEFAPNGDIFDHVHDNGPLLESTVAQVMHQMCSAVAHMHSKNIAHCDIKPENVLVSGDGKRALLCDFGRAQRWKEGDELLHAVCGTVRCLSPEVFLVDDQGTRHYNPKHVDVFGLGNLMFYLLTSHFPFEGPSKQETARNVVHNRFTTPIPTKISKSCRSFLCSLLHFDADARMTAQQALQHPFLSKMKRVNLSG